MHLIIFGYLSCLADYEVDLYQELTESLKKINHTVMEIVLKAADQKQVTTEFLKDFNELYDLITNDTYNTGNSTRYTVFLWDAAAMQGFIARQLLLSGDLSTRVKLILSTLKNHLVPSLYPTQRFVNNQKTLLTLAGKKIRPFFLIVRKVSF